MSFINRHLSAHSQRVENWLGKQQCENFSRAMYEPGKHQWYGTPIRVSAPSQNLAVDRHGDFIGRLDGGAEGSLEQLLADFEKKLRQERIARSKRQLGGFSNLAALKSSWVEQAMFGKSVTGAAAGAFNTAWFSGALPAAGAAAGAAPGGTTFDSSSTGAVVFKNAASGKTKHVVGSWLSLNAVNSSAIVYDRLHGVTKTMNSTATEAVTGVPGRYQSTTQGAADSAENNFLVIECRTVLPATAHNWTTCLYTNQSGTTNQTLPSVTGISSCAANRLDMPINTFFCPLAAGDTGIKALTQMQCSAAVATGNIDFTIGHPLFFMPVISGGYAQYLSGINSGFMFSRIFDNACLAMLSVGFNTATTASLNMQMAEA